MELFKICPIISLFPQPYKWVPETYFLGGNPAIDKHPVQGRVLSNTPMCFMRQKPCLSCVAAFFWCAFHLFHNKATDKAAQRLNPGQKRKRLGRGRGKESRGLCLVSFVLSSIVFSSNLLPQVFSFFNTIGKKSNR